MPRVLETGVPLRNVAENWFVDEGSAGDARKILNVSLYKGVPITNWAVESACRSRNWRGSAH